LKVSIILKILISVFIFFLVSTFISTLISISAIEKSVAIINLQTEYNQIGFDILNNLDRLTRLARSYGQFGQKIYYDEYLHEFNTVNIREKTITQLKELGITGESLVFINRAIDYSNELAEMEAKAFNAAANNNYEQARNLLFGEKYNDKRNQIASAVKEFQTSVNNMTEVEESRAKQFIARMFFITIGFFFSTIIAAIASFVIITKKFKSISSLTEIAKEVAEGNLDISIISDSKDELGELTRSFAVMLNSIKGITTDLSYIAKTDALTQISNRHSFFLSAPSFFDFHVRSCNPISILFFDIDDFKKINDNIGHSFGDNVLRSFAMTVSGLIRSFDLFCRYGGEEFILLLSNTDQSSGVLVGERIIENIGQAYFPARPDFKYTTSIGLYSKIPQKNESVEEYIEKADHALYLAKGNGKNRIEVYYE